MVITEKTYYLILYVILFIISQTFALTAAFITLPQKNLSVWEAYKTAIPYTWIGWIFLTYGVYIVNKYKFISPSQIIFLIIAVQYTLVLIANKFYMNENPTFSDIFAFGLIILAYFISLNNSVSKILGIHIEKEDGDNKKKEEELIKEETPAENV